MVLILHDIELWIIFTFYAWLCIRGAVLWNIFWVEGEQAETVFPFAQV